MKERKLKIEGKRKEKQTIGNNWKQEAKKIQGE